MASVSRKQTPGPLIMVLQLFGASWARGSIRVYATACCRNNWRANYNVGDFHPAFSLIFLGAPYIEQLRGTPG
jgi:hypothetical protein